jgi:hypothetical protein
VHSQHTIRHYFVNESIKVFSGNRLILLNNITIKILELLKNSFVYLYTQDLPILPYALQQDVAGSLFSLQQGFLLQFFLSISCTFSGVA